MGINVGVDGNYMLTRNYGVGVFLRAQAAPRTCPTHRTSRSADFKSALEPVFASKNPSRRPPIPPDAQWPCLVPDRVSPD